MAKIRAKVTPAAEGNSSAKSDNLHKKKKKKKKNQFWKKKARLVQAQKQQDPPKPRILLPPKTPQEVSFNWKALKELLTQKAVGSDSALCASNTYSKKKHVVKNGGAAPQDSKVNGTGQTLKFKAVDKPKKAQAEACSSAPIAKSERPAPGKIPGHTRKNLEKPKGSQGKGHMERKQGDIKHKRRKMDEQPEPAEADIWFDDVDPDDIETAVGPEAAEVARKQLHSAKSKPQQLSEQTLVKEKAFEGLTKAVAMDCEMVGVGPSGQDSILARVSIVNLFGKCIYDKYVKATEPVTDYRTTISGIRPQDLKRGEDFKVVQKEVADILRGRILVGHALHNDLKILFLDHPKKMIRDTQRYKPFKQEVRSGRPSLKLLCETLLNVKVQTAAHSSIQDAQATMKLYTMAKKKWEASLKEKRKEKKK